MCKWLDGTGEMGTEYWCWVEAVGAQDSARSEPAIGKKTGEWPVATNKAEVAAALAGVADARLAEHVKTVAEYDDSLAWVEKAGLAPGAVNASAHAWPSYLLGAEALFEDEPTIELGMPTAS